MLLILKIKWNLPSSLPAKACEIQHAPDMFSNRRCSSDVRETLRKTKDWKLYGAFNPIQMNPRLVLCMDANYAQGFTHLIHITTLQTKYYPIT